MRRVDQPTAMMSGSALSVDQHYQGGSIRTCGQLCPGLLDIEVVGGWCPLLRLRGLQVRPAFKRRLGLLLPPYTTSTRQASKVTDPIQTKRSLPNSLCMLTNQCPALSPTSPAPSFYRPSRPMTDLGRDLAPHTPGQQQRHGRLGGWPAVLPQHVVRHVHLPGSSE